MTSDLKDFQTEVLYNIMSQGIHLTVTNNAGEHYAVACLDTEPVSVMLSRVMDAGGYATVFTKGPTREDGSYDVRCAAFIDSSCSLPDAHLTDMTVEPPHEGATVGMFFDYLQMQPVGVLLPKALGIKADAVERPRTVAFA